MRLRHKKPLNPYKGQTNNDKSVFVSQIQEFNDDDFDQDGSPLKRAANGTSDQTFKYARILAKFINNINQDYRTYAAQDHRASLPNPNPFQYQPPIHESQSRRENTPFRSEQINQRREKLRTQSKKQVKEAKKELKAQLKKKEVTKAALTSQENKNKALENSMVNSLDPKNNQTRKMQTENRQKNQKSQNAAKTQPEKNGTKPIQMDNPFKMNQGFPSALNGAPSNMSAPNLTNFNNNMQTFLNYPYSSLLGQGQMLTNYYQMQMTPQMRFPMDSSIQNYLPNLQLQLNMKFLSMGLPSQLLVHQNNMGLKPFQNLFSEQVKAFNTFPPESKPNHKEVYPIKRSAYHAAIAYKIYLDKLKKEGATFENLEEIDPTRNARRIKSGQGSAKSKDALKKRK